MKINKATAAFSALSQETRLLIFKLLMEKWPEGIPAGNIAEALEMPAATISFHLSQLSGAKLVESRKEGRSVIYTANAKKAKKLANFLKQKGEEGEEDEKQEMAL